MKRSEVRRRLALEWWRQLAAALLPLFVLNLLFGAGQQPGLLTMPLFIAGLASMFVSLPLFSTYKRALVATEKALDTPAEHDAWLELARVRRLAFLGAALPAWIAAIALFAGLEAIPLILLAISSLVLMYLYRIPHQLG
ncbi:MFS transporter [Pseudomonas leptonychotis]|uniref:MFS transporter n=1 Tax=Pseudomonas leptonychotis TaxID=2448482 RepID=A0A4T1ZTT6_9PSED|nr:MFS transporter [Pseudomonas leptonychotis]TIH07715.1 MFS transporter [Pseudomonas leptonychotis]